MTQHIFTDKDYLDAQFESIRDEVRSVNSRQERHEATHSRINKTLFGGLVTIISGFIGFKATGG